MAESTYRELLKLRDAVFGPLYENSLPTLLTLISLLNATKKEQEAQKLLEKALKDCQAMMKEQEETGQDRKRTANFYVEFLKLKYNWCGFKQLTMDQLQVSKEYNEFAKTFFGRESEEHADSLYLQCKAQF